MKKIVTYLLTTYVDDNDDDNERNDIDGTVWLC